MSLNSTPNGERIHIGFFGRRNAGKSSIFNAITGQNLAITSDIPGTTTDPVSKAMEILPLGPVYIIDTPGFDDVRYDFEPMEIEPGDYSVTFVTEGRTYKIHTTDKQEEGKVVGLKFGKDDIHVMEKTVD